MLGAVAVVFLLVSTGTAIPQTQSTPVMQAVQHLEKTNEAIDDVTSENIVNIQTLGLIDFLIQLIRLIIELLMNIVTIIQGILSIVSIVQTIFSAIQLVIQLIQQIIDLFTPNALLE